MTPPAGRDARRRRLRGQLIVLAAVVGALSVPTTLYLGYDLLKGRLSKCDSISRATSVHLTTEIEFLKVKGKVHLGREKVAELSDRARATADSLKTCCVVLDGGKLNQEAFLQCQAQARHYVSNVDSISKLVRGAVAAETRNLTSEVQKATRSIGEMFETARQTSKDLNRRVVRLRREQAIAQLEITPPSHVDVKAQEKEPNDEILHANLIGVDRWITAAIAGNRDTDYYVFTTPDVHRDIIRIELENRSATLRPSLNLYNADKARIGGINSGTPGANLSYRLTVPPKTRYYVLAGNYNRGTKGAYLLRVLPLKAYDGFEPNDTILRAKPVSLGSPTEAGIMDSHDIDYYSIEAGGTGGAFTVRLENRSATLRPSLNLYNGDKVRMGGVNNATPGANLTYRFQAKPGTRYYVLVGTYNRGTAGAYTLTVKGP